jgi:hypothetical protein
VGYFRRASFHRTAEMPGRFHGHLTTVSAAHHFRRQGDLGLAEMPSRKGLSMAGVRARGLFPLSLFHWVAEGPSACPSGA